MLLNTKISTPPTNLTKKHEANIYHIKFSLIEKRGGLSKFKNENQAEHITTKKTVEKFDIYNMQCTNCGILDKKHLRGVDREFKPKPHFQGRSKEN